MSNFRKSLLQRYPIRKYLRSTGTQYIDTGLKITDATGTIEIKFAPRKINKRLSWGNSGYNGIVGENKEPQIGWCTEGWTTGNQYSSKPYMPVIEKSYIATWGYDTNAHIFIDGQDTGLSRTGTLTVKLFYVEGKPDNGEAKIYYCKVKNTNGNITHYFVPCIFGGVAGLFDRIEKKFYSNSGSGTFIIEGKDILDHTLYDYIESTGTQYINTGLTLTKNTGTIEIKFEPTEINSQGTDAGTEYNGVAGENKEPQIGWYPGGWTIGNAGSSLPYLPEVGKTYIATWGHDTNEHLYIDGQDTGISRGTTFTVILFYVAGKPTNAKVKLYYCKIYDANGNLIHHFVPVTFEDLKGLWDTVGDVFYRNDGTGEFNMGNIIE